MKLVPHSEWTGSASQDQGASVQKILEGTLRAIRNIGTRRLSMSDISDASGVSRGTLYRYFASKEAVLTAVSEYICYNFEQGIAEASHGITDPIERFVAVMRFYARFTIERSPEGIFEVEPAFHLEFLRSHFERHKAAVRDALEISLNHFEQICGTAINRDAFVEALVRLQLSTLIVPANEEWIQCWNDTPEHLFTWIMDFAGASAGRRERID